MVHRPCTDSLIEINFISLKEWMKSAIWLLKSKTTGRFRTASCRLTREYPDNLDYPSSLCQMLCPGSQKHCLQAFWSGQVLSMWHFSSNAPWHNSYPILLNIPKNTSPYEIMLQLTCTSHFAVIQASHDSCFLSMDFYPSKSSMRRTRKPFLSLQLAQLAG